MPAASRMLSHHPQSLTPVTAVVYGYPAAACLPARTLLLPRSAHEPHLFPNCCSVLADVLQTLSDSTIRLNLGPGVAPSSATGQVASKPQPPVRRAALLARDAAEECAEAMFLRRAGGPHPSGSLPVADYPTIEEIAIGQAAVAVKIGEKGSEERARASQLAALGTIAKEEALGFWLCDRFRGAVPSSQRAHAIAKVATDRLPPRKEKDRWKEKARQARKAAEKRGADGDEVAAAGQRAAAAARAAFEQVEVDLGMERPPAGPPAPEPPSVSPDDAADGLAPEAADERCRIGRRPDSCRAARNGAVEGRLHCDHLRVPCGRVTAPTALPRQLANFPVGHGAGQVPACAAAGERGVSRLAAVAPRRA
jgi:hypothetical protein